MSSARMAISVLLLSVSMLTVVVSAEAGSPMVDKNLFSQSRRPDAPQASPEAPKTGPPDVALKNMQLDAVMMVGDKKKAILRTKGGKGRQGAAPGKQQQPESPYLTVAEGDLVGDFKVSKIESKNIVLEKDGQKHELALFAEGKVVPPAPPAPAMPNVNVPPTMQNPAGNQGRRAVDAAAAKGQRIPQGQAPHMRPNVNVPPGPGGLVAPGVPQMPGGGGDELLEELPDDAGGEAVEEMQAMEEGGN